MTRAQGNAPDQHQGSGDNERDLFGGERAPLGQGLPRGF
jgi:hypothetical protein